MRVISLFFQIPSIIQYGCSSSYAVTDFLAKVLNKLRAQKNQRRHAVTWGGDVYFLSCGVHILCKESREFSESWWDFRPAWRPFSSTSSYGFSLGDSPSRWFFFFFKEKKNSQECKVKKKIIMWTKWKAFKKAPRLSAWLIPLAAAGSIWRRTWLWGRQVSLGFFYCFFFF